MSPTDGLEVGDIVQIRPDGGMRKAWGGCLIVVTEVLSFGAQGFLAFPQALDEPASCAYVRVAWANMEKVGRAEWIMLVTLHGRGEPS